MEFDLVGLRWGREFGKQVGWGRFPT